MEINIFITGIMMFVLMVLVPPIILLFLQKHPKTIKIITIILAVIYAILLIIGTTARVYVSGTNLVIRYPNSADWFSMHFAVFNKGKANILVNLALLFPIGPVVYVFSKSHPFLKTVLISFAISLIIETYQFILPIFRTTELADLILNTISGTLSAIYCEILTKLNLFSFKVNSEFQPQNKQKK